VCALFCDLLGVWGWCVNVLWGVLVVVLSRVQRDRVFLGLGFLRLGFCLGVGWMTSWPRIRVRTGLRASAGRGLCVSAFSRRCGVWVVFWFVAACLGVCEVRGQGLGPSRVVGG